MAMTNLSVLFEVIDKASGKMAEIARTTTVTTGSMFSANKKVISTIEKEGKATRILTKNYQRFNFEMLGTMFFGMSIARTFNRMTAESWELTGVADVMTDTFTDLTIDAISPLSDIIFSLAEKIQNLSPEMKSFIGNFIVGGEIFGIFLSTVGQVALGLASLSIIFGSVTAGVIVLVAAFAIITLAILAFTGKLDDINWEGIWSKITDTLAGIIGTLSGILGEIVDSIIKFFVETDWKKAWAILFATAETFISDIGTYIGGLFNAVSDWFGKQDWDKVLSKIVEFGTGFISNVTSFARNMVNKIIDFIAGVDWFKAWSVIFNVGGKLLIAIATFVGVLAGNIFRFIATIDWFRLIYTIIASFISAILAAIVNLVPAAISAVFSAIGGLLEGMGFGTKAISVPSASQLVTTSGTNQNINFNPTFNITGAGDKDELERMLKENNDSMMTDLKRMVQSG